MKQSTRLTRSTDIKRVRRLGKSYAHPLLVLVVMPNDLDVSRSAIVASHTVGKAVERNLARRRIRACLTDFQPYIGKGADLVWVVRAPLANAEYADIRNAVCLLLNRAALYQRDCNYEG